MTERVKRHETAFSNDEETSITELFLFWRRDAKTSKNVAIGPLAQPRPKNSDENNVTNYQPLPKPNPGPKLVTKINITNCCHVE